MFTLKLEIYGAKGQEHSKLVCFIDKIYL